MGKRLKALDGPQRWGLVALAVLGAFVLGLLLDGYQPRFPLGQDEDEEKVERPLPAEFLYLDNERVGAYLAQLNGGIAKSERLSQTLTKEENASASTNFFEVGASSQRQNFVERQVTPTAAANFFRLYALLLDQEKLHPVSVEDLEDFGQLGEGAFVRFESHDLRPPTYVNSYLVVRQAGTLKALFPTAGTSSYERERVLDTRDNAENYARQIGPNPRIVFALTPRERKGIRFLLPVRYQQLTDERSLIKDGGGRFTVVGKVARAFRTARNGKRVVYRDSPTIETWRNPLEHVPGPLLLRSSRLCATPAGASEAVELDPAELRDCVLDRLMEQTTIPRRGAVILPIAIYK